MACGLRVRARGSDRADDEDPPVHGHVRADGGAVRGTRSAPDRRRRGAPYGRRVRPAPEGDAEALQRSRAALLRAAGRVLLLPEHHVDGNGRRAVRGAAPPRREGRHGPRERGRRARARARPRVLCDKSREDRRGVRTDRALCRTSVTATDTTSTPTQWLARFERSLHAGDPLGASDTLRKSGLNGWVRKDHYDLAVKVIDRIGPAPRVRLDWAERLLAHPRRVDKELAGLVLWPLARTHSREVTRIGYRLARDDDWAVRETAAALLGQALTETWADTIPLLREWVSGPDSRLRRAVVVAAKYAARTRTPEWAEPLLDLIEPALRDHQAD